MEKPIGKDFDLSVIKEILEQHDDDDFFHLTCHINPALRKRIEQGLYVDLERLLPKN